ncbi:PheS-related mystery ligase SrmL [Kineococcus sp. SYSU DK018]|uniref:PheS-related mystery ligase SrmL n=1 Tax=Kineococcus sp. SYSU DK018 TaxID=3383139 RepID=UPI003D7E0401
MRTTASLLPARDLLRALQLRDLTDPAQGPHAVQLLFDDVLAALTDEWGCDLDVRRRHPLVAVEDNYDRLGYAPGDVTRDARYSRYVTETVMLRSHTSAGIPPVLRDLAAAGPRPGLDVLLALPGVVHRRDSIDRLHVGTPHQVDLWRVVVAGADDPSPLPGRDDLQQMIALLVQAVLPGADWRTVPAVHPYTRDGAQVDVRTPAGWVELAECGLIADHVLTGAGLDPARTGGLALGMGLDRALMLRKGIDDIRTLRSSDPRVAAQLLDLSPWRPVSSQPPVRRDLSIVTDAGVDAELLGDDVRTALGADAEDLESVAVLATTPHEDLPPAAQHRLGTRPGQVNVLLRLVLRPLGGTLTDEQANRLRDRVYAAVHRGPHVEWAGGEVQRVQWAHSQHE